MTKTKEAMAVERAKQAANIRAAELQAAREALERLEGEHAIAVGAIRRALAAEEATYPQCRMVRVHWRSGAEENSVQVGILRRTPGGQLVVRHLGSEYRFKWSRDHYVQAEKANTTGVYLRELRDVPAEYLPAEAGGKE